MKPACYPCHRLHYGDAFCHLEEFSRTSLCSFHIEPADVWDAVAGAFNDWRSVRSVMKAAA